MITHAVTNQPPPLTDYNTYKHNRPLIEAVRREGAEWAESSLEQFGAVLGREQKRRLAEQANTNPPVLKTHDRYGNRIDEVEFHPAWHELMTLATGYGVHSMPWRDPRPGAHAARTAHYMLYGQLEAGTCCPLTMTFASVPALAAQPEILGEWQDALTALKYSPELSPIAEKGSALCGMAMTEKQGGSDVRANTTSARALNGGGPGGEYAITGHKWFCSAPMSDAFLILAQADEGLSCFFVPRVLPDGSRNTFLLQRLKDKLGNRSNASSEVEFSDTWGRMVGEPGRGVPTIIEMVNHTRLDCVIGSAAMMSASVAQATHHAAHRAAFGRQLIDQPLMQNVLADLCIESEATTIAAMRLARAYDLAAENEQEIAFRRIANAVLKYWTTKRAIAHTAEALECLGGAGYVEESGMPRLYREAPLNSIWEGSGNVNCLDVMRALVKSPTVADAFVTEVESARGSNTELDLALDRLKDQLVDTADFEPRARRTVELMALVLQGSLLVRYGDQTAADAFCAARLGGDSGLAFGTLSPRGDFTHIVERHRPEV